MATMFNIVNSVTTKKKDGIKMSTDTKEKLAACGVVVAIVFVMALITVGPWIVGSSFEAAAFNRATGSNVSTWDAMWIELRVQDAPAKGK